MNSSTPTHLNETPNNPETPKPHSSQHQLAIDSNLSELEYQDTQIYSPSSIGVPASVASKRDFGKSPVSTKEKQVAVLTGDLRRSIERLDKVIGKSHVALNNGIQHLSLKNKAAVINKQTATPIGSAKKVIEAPKKLPGTKPVPAMRIEDPYQVKLNGAASFNSQSRDVLFAPKTQ